MQMQPLFWRGLMGQSAFRRSWQSTPPSHGVFECIGTHSALMGSRISMLPLRENLRFTRGGLN
jgi:hypothetical protein